MASIVSILKRKLALILPPTSANRELATGTIDDDDHNTHRPHKRQRHILLGDGGDDDDAGTATATSMSGTATPYLLSESARFPPPSKLLKQGNFDISLNDYNFGKKSSSSSSSCTSSSHLILNLTHLPNDILSHCLYYIHTRSDRFGLQVSCKTLYHASNTDKMLAHLDLGGDVTAIAHHRGANNFYGEVNEDATARALGNNDGNEEVEDDDDPDAFVLVRRLQLLRHRGNIIGGNDEDDDVVDEGGVGNEGRLPVENVGAAGAAQSTELLPPRTRSIAGGLILDCDTSVSACTKLIKFAAAGNVQAMYMYVWLLDG